MPAGKVNLVLVRRFLMLGAVSAVRHLLAVGAELLQPLRPPESDATPAAIHLVAQRKTIQLANHQALLWDLVANGVILAVLLIGYRLVYPLASDDE
jgi:hypothetical protein